MSLMDWFISEEFVLGALSLLLTPVPTGGHRSQRILPWPCLGRCHLRPLGECRHILATGVSLLLRIAYQASQLAGMPCQLNSLLREHSVF